MAKNPFRDNPISKTEQSVAEWGKVKFKPNKFGSGRSNHFKNRQEGEGNNVYNRKFDNRNGDSNSSKDSYKFNQVAKDAKPENATPWNKFKNEIVFKQREEEQAALQANMVGKDAKQALKQREINYRKLLMEQKKQEPTKWENFVDEYDADNSKKKHKSFKNTTSFENNKNIQTLDSKPKKNVQNNVSNYQAKGEVMELIPQELLNKFDSKKLSFQQNDKMRKIITKATCLANGCSLQMTIRDMKRKKALKNKKTNNF